MKVFFESYKASYSSIIQSVGCLNRVNLNLDVSANVVLFRHYVSTGIYSKYRFQWPEHLFTAALWWRKKHMHNLWSTYFKRLLSVVVFTEMCFQALLNPDCFLMNKFLFDTGSWPAPSLSCVSRWTWPDSSWRMRFGIWTARSNSWTPCRVKPNCSGGSLWHHWL